MYIVYYVRPKSQDVYSKNTILFLYACSGLRDFLEMFLILQGQNRHHVSKILLIFHRLQCRMARLEQNIHILQYIGDLEIRQTMLLVVKQVTGCTPVVDTGDSGEMRGKLTSCPRSRS